MTDIETKLTSFVNDELLMRSADDAIGVDEDLLMSGLLDSIAVMRLVGYIEDGLNVAVPPEDVTLENFSSVAAISQFLSALPATDA